MGIQTVIHRVHAFSPRVLQTQSASAIIGKLLALLGPEVEAARRDLASKKRAERWAQQRANNCNLSPQTVLLAIAVYTLSDNDVGIVGEFLRQRLKLPEATWTNKPHGSETSTSLGNLMSSLQLATHKRRRTNGCTRQLRNSLRHAEPMISLSKLMLRKEQRPTLEMLQKSI